MPGRWTPQGVVVDSKAEASRLHNKGRFGRPQSGGGLTLDPVEAAYLVEAERLRIEGLEALTDVLAEGAREIPGFLVRFLAYRDLRTRGHLLAPAQEAAQRNGVAFLAWRRGSSPPRSKPSMAVVVVSEREPARVSAMLEWTSASALDSLLVVLVDEESDVTYYRLDSFDPQGQRGWSSSVDAEAVFLGDRVVLGDPDTASRLHRDGFFGKSVGQGLQLSLVEASFLARQAGLRIRDAVTGRRIGRRAFGERAEQVDADHGMRLRVFEDLARRGLTVKTGFKFGTHFRAYTEDPGSSHAPFLVHAVPPDVVMGWPQVSRAVRMAHTVRKELLWAVVGPRHVRYLRLVRARP